MFCTCTVLTNPQKSLKILKHLSPKMLVSRVCWQHSVHNSIFAASEPPSRAWVCRQVFSSLSYYHHHRHDMISYILTEIMCPNCYVVIIIIIMIAIVIHIPYSLALVLFSGAVRWRRLFSHSTLHIVQCDWELDSLATAQASSIPQPHKQVPQSKHLRFEELESENLKPSWEYFVLASATHFHR